MRLKTSQTIALERGRPDYTSNDIELLGTEALLCVDEFKHLNVSSKDNSFLSVFGLDVKFFYSLELKSNEAFVERGLGYVEQHDGKFFLKRSRPFYIIDNGVTLSAKRLRPIVCSDEECLLVSSYTPTTFIETLTDSNSIITSISPHIPTSVVVGKNSVLGRREENVESIPLTDLLDEGQVSQFALNAIKQYTKNLILNSPKVNVKRISTNDLQLNPQKSAPQRKGVLYYDEKDDLLKYYDGQKWRMLVWTED